MHNFFINADISPDITTPLNQLFDHWVYFYREGELLLKKNEILGINLSESIVKSLSDSTNAIIEAIQMMDEQSVTNDEISKKLLSAILHAQQAYARSCLDAIKYIKVEFHPASKNFAKYSKIFEDHMSVERNLENYPDNQPGIRESWHNIKGNSIPPEVMPLNILSKSRFVEIYEKPVRDGIAILTSYKYTERDINRDITSLKLKKWSAYVVLTGALFALIRYIFGLPSIIDF